MASRSFLHNEGRAGREVKDTNEDSTPQFLLARTRKRFVATSGCICSGRHTTPARRRRRSMQRWQKPKFITIGRRSEHDRGCRRCITARLVGPLPRQSAPQTSHRQIGGVVAAVAEEAGHAKGSRTGAFDPKPAAFILWDSSGCRHVSETSATTSLLVWNQTATIGFLVRETAVSLTACSLVPGNAFAVGHDRRRRVGQPPRAVAGSRSTLCGRGRPFFGIPPVVATVPGCFFGEAI